MTGGEDSGNNNGIDEQEPDWLVGLVEDTVAAASVEQPPVIASDQLLDALTNNISQHSFVSAVRRLSCLYPDQLPPGRAAKLSDEALRLSQNISTSFNGTSLDRLESSAGKHAQRLYVNFFGLLGANGPLPYHYTEHADQRTRHFRDSTFQEFLDIFNHRLLGLFYRADADVDPSINLDRPDANRYDLYIGALAGLGQDSSKKRDQIPYYSKLQFAHWMGCKSKSPDGIKAIVGGYFDVNVDVDEFVGAWLSLPENSQSRLGVETGNMALGSNIYLGKRVWSSRHKFRVRLGPLTWHEYLSFKPGGNRIEQLYDLLRNYVGDEWDWELELVVEKRKVEALKLDRSSTLGYTSWLSGKSAQELSQQSTILQRDTIRHSLGNSLH